MTNGVRQALPQLLAQPSNGGLKGQRGRAPQENFAEALGIGKHSRPMKPETIKANRQDENYSLPAWPQIAAKLDTGVSQVKEARQDNETEESETRSGSPKVDSAEDVQPAGVHVPETTQPPVPASARSAIASEAKPETTPAEQKLPPLSSREPHARSENDKTPDEGKAFVPRAPESRAAATTGPSFVPIGRSEPARVEPATAQLATDRADRRQAADDTLPEASAEPAKSVPRVTNLAQQNIPAPMPSTALALVETIAASDLVDPSNTRPMLDAIHTSAAHASVQSLKLQLHPAELGMVTATLRFAGEQLSIELQVENHEAYRRLAGDSDTIVGSLRKLGYEVDSVTVLQPAIASSPTVRADAPAPMPSSQGRPAGEFGSGTANGGSQGFGGRASGDGGNAGRGSHREAPPRKENAAAGLYI